MAGAPEGNKNAVKEKRLITSALNRAVVQNPDKLANACMKVLEDAENGSLASLSFIADRLDGKPAQAVIHQGDSESPLEVVAKIILEGFNDDSDR